MWEQFKKLDYKFSVLSNLIFFISAGFQILSENYITASYMALVGVASFMFHFYLSMYHQSLKNGIEWSKEKFKSLKKWQYADVASIYLVFGAYPYDITNNPLWLLFMIPMLFMAFNKFNILLPKWSPSSTIAVSLSALPTIILGFIYLNMYAMIIGIIFLAGAGYFSRSAENHIEHREFKKYDWKHAIWHKFAAIAFAVIR